LELSDVEPKIYGTFGGRLYSLYISNEGINAVKRLLCVIGYMYQEIDYCPFLPNLTQLLLIKMNEEEAFSCLKVISEKSIKEKYYFYLSNAYFDSFIETFKDFMKKYLPNLTKRNF
jgi:hypothetical protein